MNNEDTLKDLLNKEIEEDKKQTELLELTREINDMKKTTNDLEIGNTALEKKINDAKADNAKLLTEVSLYGNLIEKTKSQVKDFIENVDREKNKLNDIQSEVWYDLENFTEMPSFMQDPDFQKVSEKCDEELREMEKEILKLSGEVEAMHIITEAQEEKIKNLQKTQEKESALD